MRPLLSVLETVFRCSCESLNNAEFISMKLTVWYILYCEPFSEIQGEFQGNFRGI